MRTKISIFVYCLYLYNNSLAQSFTFRNYTVAEGLPSSEVYDVIQDSRGFMWFATDNGVVRFDGFEMVTFGVRDGLSDPVVFEIVEDHRNRIWFRTFSSQLFFYENGRIKPYQFNNLTIKASARARMNAMHIDSVDRLWFTNLWGVMSRIDGEGNLLQDSLPAKQVIYRAEDTIHFIGWQAHNKGKKKWGYYVNFDGKFFSIGSDFVANNSICPIVKWRGSQYIAFGNVIFEYDGQSLKKAFTSHVQILSLTVDQEDHLWVSYHNGGGAERYNSPDFRKPFKPNFVKSRSVSKIYVDKESGLWITTLDRGVFYVPNTAVEFRDYPGKVSAVFSSGQKVIAGTDDGVVTIMQSEGVVRSSKVSDVRHSPVFMDSKGNFWVTGKNFSLFDKDLSKIRSYDQIFLGTPASFAEDANGNVWGMAYGGYYLRKFDSTFKMVSVIRDDSRKIVRDILITGSNLYIAGALGLSIYDTSAMKLIHVPSSLATFKISKMLNLNDSTLLLATIGNGILVVNKRNWSFEKYSKENRLIADNIYTATVSDSMLWLGTEKGILATNLDSLIDNNANFLQFSQDQGLNESKINFLAITDSLIWAFSDKGISIVPLAAIQAKNRPPEFYIKNFFVNKRPVEVGKDLCLFYDHTDIEIIFGFLSLKNQNILSRYRLNNKDSWIYINERRLHFSSLAPADYQLVIEYSVDNLVWTKVDFDLRFEVTPPWWRRWYVQVPTLVLIVSLVYFYVRNHYRALHSHRLQVLQTEFQTLDRERKRIAKELHDGVATNLSAIKLTVGHLLKDHPLGADVNEHFHMTLKEIKAIIYELTPPGLEQNNLSQSLRNYIDKLNKTIPMKIYLQTVGEEVHKPALGLVLFRIMQELLANSIKHSRASNIFIRLESTPIALKIEYQDNGVGFSFDDSKGMGLTNIQSRIKSVKGNLSFSSAPNMTCYTIHLPLH